MLRRIPPRTRRIIGVVVAAMMFLVLIGVTYQGVATSLERRDFTRPGGLGDVAIRYGYQQYSWIHIVAVIVIIFAIVMVLQSLAAWGARRLGRRSTRRSARVAAASTV